MRMLSDLIKERSEDLDIQIAVALAMSPDDAEWLHHKKLVDTLPANYQNILKEKLAKDPFCIRKKDYGKSTWITINIIEYSHKYETVFMIKENKESGLVEKVVYVAYRNIPPIAYVREII